MRSTIIMLLLAAHAAGLSAQATVLAPDELCAGGRGAAIASFEDARFEQAVRDALDAPGDARLTCEQLAGVTTVEARRGIGIESLGGAQNLTSLERLFVWEQSIEDLSPLRDLTTLTALDLGSNEIRDIEPLSGLVRLDTLYLNRNHIEDVRPLAGLTRLDNLSITYNSVRDIGPLAGLTELRTLRVYNNPLTDIGVMRGFTKLHELHVHDLPGLTDIEPLIENPGLGPGDRVILSNTGVSCADVDRLRAKGVGVSSDCWQEDLLPAALVVVLGATVAVLLVGLWLRRRSRLDAKAP